MAKDTIARKPLPPPPPPRKGHISLADFLNRIRPSHRAEQGGTTRTRDVSGDDNPPYLDSRVNTNTLIGWNLPREHPPPGPSSPQASTGNETHRGRSGSIQRNRGELDDDPVQSPFPALSPNPVQLPPPERPNSNPLPKPQHQQTQLVASDEISTILKTKEDTRRQRRHLEESGDWLSVQGADPYSGQFTVLTPTTTISTDSTPPFVKERLAESIRKQEAAKLTYEQARLEAEKAREYHLVEKERLRLQKMEQAKEERRQQQHQQQFPIWIRHKRRWTSTAEPDLSTNPQSTKTYECQNSSDEGDDVATRKVSCPPVSGTGTSQSKLAETFGKSVSMGLSKRDPHVKLSTDTIVHKTPPNTEFMNTTTQNAKDLYPPVFADVDDVPTTQEQRNDGHFLWLRRRRTTDPGKSIKRRISLIINPSAGTGEKSPRSVSVEQLPPAPRLQPWQGLRNHFSDLIIPDHHLHLVPYSDPMERLIEESLTPVNHDPLPAVLEESPIKSIQDDMQVKPALRVATNHSDYLESQMNFKKDVSNAKDTSSTSSQSKTKGVTKPPPMPPRVIPARKSSFRSSQTQVSPQSQSPNQTRPHTHSGLPDSTLCPQDSLQKSVPSTMKHIEIPKSQTDNSLKGRPQRGRTESASTLTTTTTGFDPDHQVLPDLSQLHLRAQNHGENDVKGNDATRVMPSAQGGGREHRDASTPKQQRSAIISSRHSTPQNVWESFVLKGETPATDTSSTNLAPREFDSTPPTPHLQAPGSYPDLHDVLTKRAWEEPSVATYLPTPPHDTDEARSIRRGGFNTDGDRVTYQHLAPRGQKEAIIHEAARIEMQRSRAIEIDATRHRTPSPRTQDRDSWDEPPVTPSGHSATTTPQNVDTGGNGAGVEFPFIKSDSTGLQDSSSLRRQGAQRINPRLVEKQDTQEDLQAREDGKFGTRADYDRGPPGTVVTLVSLLITAYMMVFSVASAWWILVQLTFDLGCELWRQRRIRNSTWGDITIIVAACLFVSRLLGFW
ncbi:hypothetical protein GGR50DRAFT_388200 [Xylaria sp. CBS 124048]|nr:hypothetical protein GGR50DRAFT_388200 [Xylaria sp. CBS 124048]